MTLLFNLPLTGPDGSVSIVDTSGNTTWQANGDASIQANALYLDGTGDYISTPTDDRFYIGSGTFEIAFELNVLAVDAGSFLIIIDQLNTNSSLSSWQVYLFEGRLYFQAYSASGGDQTVVSSPTSIADGTWHAVIIRKVGQTVSLLIDGNLVASASDGRIYVREPSFVIGARRNFNSTTAFMFRGRLRNFSLDVTPVQLAGVFNRSRVRVQPVGWDRPMRRGDFRRMEFYPVFPVETKRNDGLRITRGVPPWWGAPGSTTVVPTQRLRGRVMQRDEDAGEDYPLANVRVALFYRRLHTLIDIRRSDMDGYVVFENLMPGSQAYYAIAFDNDDGVMQNAVIWDRLTPEPGA